MQVPGLFSTFPRRLSVATALWIFFWPLFWYIKTGDITGAKSWFWIIGELNYPIALFCFHTIDGMVRKSIKTDWKIFVLTTLVVVAMMPFLYKWVGFKMAVLLEAVISGFLP